MFKGPDGCSVVSPPWHREKRRTLGSLLGGPDSCDSRLSRVHQQVSKTAALISQHALRFFRDNWLGSLVQNCICEIFLRSCGLFYRIRVFCYWSKYNVRPFRQHVGLSVAVSAVLGLVGGAAANPGLSQTNIRAKQCKNKSYLLAQRWNVKFKLPESHLTERWAKLSTSWLFPQWHTVCLHSSKAPHSLCPPSTFDLSRVSPSAGRASTPPTRWPSPTAGWTRLNTLPPSTSSLIWPTPFPSSRLCPVAFCRHVPEERTQRNLLATSES